MNPDEELRPLQDGINDRQQELHRVTDLLAWAAQRTSTRAAGARVAVIVLGAIAATSGVSNELAGASSAPTILFYTAVGLLITAISGIEAAFKLESRAAELRLLSASSQSAARQIDSQWHREIGSVRGDAAVAAAQRLLDVQDTKLADIQEQAAKLGVNLTVVIRELTRDEPPYPA